MVLALKLAEMVAARARGEVPLFLIDDVSSELDAERTARLVGRLATLGGQVFATTTDPGPMTRWGFLHLKPGLEGDQGNDLSAPGHIPFYPWRSIGYGLGRMKIDHFGYHCARQQHLRICQRNQHPANLFARRIGAAWHLHAASQLLR